MAGMFDFEELDKYEKEDVIEKEMNKNPASFAQAASKGFVNVMIPLSTIVDAVGLSSSDQYRLTALVHSQLSASDDDSVLGDRLAGDLNSPPPIGIRHHQSFRALAAFGGVS